ncbi:hypothetical protein MHTCC0001_08830 [Flavobacteriaceae bacterium MHTCC 0001]
MNKISLLFIVILIFEISYSQEGFDPGTPTNAPFQLGSDIQGTIQNSVNEVTGKVTFTAPLASIASGSTSYVMSLSYNGQASFKNGQQINKYNPTGIAGVGWGFSTPKIMVDHKSTGTREDDDFYLIDGVTNSKLLCINKKQVNAEDIWEFQMEKYAPWVIQYHVGRQDFDLDSQGNLVPVYITLDYWSVVKEDGVNYYFGSNDTTTQSKETTIVWGNWIGSSKQQGGSEHTIVWNLSRIKDQWENALDFEYELTEVVQSGSSMQTEASYLKKVTSSKGASIQLTYAVKTGNEFYEPHTEMSEPDAYPERYEQKYLQSVSSYNNDNILLSTFNLSYQLNGTGGNTKRYLTSLAQTVYNNGSNETLPAQTFEYHYTGDFKGGIKKAIYPTGGSVTYNYKKKELFNNTADLYASSFNWPSGYSIHSKIVKDTYTLYLLRTNNPYAGGKYRFKIFRFWWNGLAWTHNEFTFPHLIDEPDHWNPLLDFYTVFGENFYGFTYDKGTSADVYLFHLADNGRSWDYYTSTSRTIGNGYPYFVSGKDFVSLGGKYNGKLHTYVWNGDSWNYKEINQGTGEYFMAAANNFILSLDERDSSNTVDMVTGATHSDYYYIHYLDAQKIWQTKSWSAGADPYINDIWITQTSPGNAALFPSNSIAGLVAKDNPELLLRWDANYNLISVDNVLGTHNDFSLIAGVDNSMFTIYHHLTKRPNKTARFNGVGWVEEWPTDPGVHSYIEFGMDLFSYADNTGNGRKYYNYNPNTNSWQSGYVSLPNLSHMPPHTSPNYVTSINQDFIQIGHKLFKKSTSGGNLFAEIGSLNNYAVNQSRSDGLFHTFVLEGGNPSDFTERGKFYYIDKSDGILKYISQNEIKYPTRNIGAKFGGHLPFISPNSICLVSTNESTNLWNQLRSISHTNLHRIIDDKINNQVYDIVVNHIDINDDNGNIRKVQYTYNQPQSAPDNSATFYGEVTIENKGIGNGNIGKVVKVFNNGAEDLAMVGLPLQVLTIDTNNKLVKRNTMTWRKFTKTYQNGVHDFYNSYYIRSTASKEELFFVDSPTIVNTTTNTYNSIGLQKASTNSDSNGRTVVQETSYAYNEYNFLNAKNMLAFPSVKTTRVSGSLVNVERSNWVEVNGKAYITENWSGPSFIDLRLNSRITDVEGTTGNVLESTNGNGLYKCVLFGYDNLYEVATISNAKYQDVINQLDVTYTQLQNLSAASLKTELLKLYDRLPNASISLSFYDANGRITSTVDNREQEAFVYYDTLGREDYITDAEGNVLEKKMYHFNN